MTTTIVTPVENPTPEPRRSFFKLAPKHYWLAWLVLFLAPCNGWFLFLSTPGLTQTQTIHGLLIYMLATNLIACAALARTFSPKH